MNIERINRRSILQFLPKCVEIDVQLVYGENMIAPF